MITIWVRTIHIFVVGLLLVVAVGCGDTPQPKPSLDTVNVTSIDTTALASMPAIGKWMMDSDGTPAHWLDEVYQGKYLREPINIIILDYAAKSDSDAKHRLLAALQLAGFPSRAGHSNDYWGSIGGKRYEQLGDRTPSTFSDGLYEFDNNHGRIFGPCAYNGGYLWIGAFSREKVVPFAKIKHQYVSFNQSRDAIAQNLDVRTTFHRTHFIPLNNALLGHPDTTTGDHDGIGVLLESRE